MFGDNTNFFAYKNYNFQLEEGEVATEYEPYKETRESIYLNSPLLNFKIEYNIYIGDIVVFNDNGTKRQGKVQDISKCVKWLIEDEYTTGQVISINGGWVI